MEIIVVYHPPSQTEGCQMPNKIRCFLCSGCWVSFEIIIQNICSISLLEVFFLANSRHLPHFTARAMRFFFLAARPLCQPCTVVCLLVDLATDLFFPSTFNLLFGCCCASFVVRFGKIETIQPHTFTLGRTRCGGSGYCCCKTKSCRFISMKIKTKPKISESELCNQHRIHAWCVQRAKNMNAENEIKWMNRLRSVFFFFKFYFIFVQSSFVNTICLLNSFTHLDFSYEKHAKLRTSPHLTWHGQYASH